MTAFGNEYAAGVYDQYGIVMRFLDDVEQRAEDHREYAQTCRELASFAAAELGATRRDVDRKLQQSINADIYKIPGDNS